MRKSPSSSAHDGDPTPSSDIHFEQQAYSVRSLVDQLDKAFKFARLYDIANPAAQSFINKVYQDLTMHLRSYGSLWLTVQGFRLFYGSQLVYENSLPMENIAFRLYVDGIREISFHRGLSKDDFAYFLETLAGEFNSETADEDIVTRLWGKNLTAISVVTAEEVVKALEESSVIIPQDAGTMNRPIGYLKKIRAAEIARQEKEEAGGRITAGGAMTQSNSALFDVFPLEMEKLAREIQEESNKTDSAYVLEVLIAILSSKQSLFLLSEILELLEEILEKLIRDGKWEPLAKLFYLLREVERNPEHSIEHRMALTNLLETPARPENIQAIADFLNQSTRVASEEFLRFLLHLGGSAVPSLCDLLTMLRHQEHRSLVGEALVSLAKETPEPLVERLSDYRNHFVRDFISVISRLGDPSLAAALEQVSRNERRQVRVEAVRALAILLPSGDGRLLATFVRDTDESIRRAALRFLTSGIYTVPASAWYPMLSDKAFLRQSQKEKRLLFLAMSLTAGEEMVPYFQRLLTQWLWFPRKGKRELAILAAETLGRMGTPEANAALELGKKRHNRAIRQACSAALEKRFEVFNPSGANR